MSLKHLKQGLSQTYLIDTLWSVPLCFEYAFCCLLIPKERQEEVGHFVVMQRWGCLEGCFRIIEVIKVTLHTPYTCILVTLR